MKKSFLIKLFLIATIFTVIFCLVSCGNDDTSLPEENQGDQGLSENSKKLKFRINDDGESFSVIGVEAEFVALRVSDIVIPSEHEGKPVTSIGNNAFDGITWLKSITIPDSITSIGERAFNACHDLEDLYFNGGIEDWCNIEFSYPASNPMIPAENAYINGTLVKDLVIPDGITGIGMYTFSGCDSITSVTIPSSVTSIGVEAFSYCSNLSKIDILDSVENIECGAFMGCSALTSIVIPNSITTINQSTFYDCTSLESVTIGKSVNAIESSAFAYCISLTSIVYDGLTTDWKCIDKSYSVTGWRDDPANWNLDTGEYIVYCTNGQITKDGKTINN